MTGSGQYVYEYDIRNAVIHNTSFCVSNIYEELFITQNIVPQNCNNSRKLLQIKARYLRNKDDIHSPIWIYPFIFTGQRNAIQHKTVQVFCICR